MEKPFELGKESFNIKDFKSFTLVADIGGENSYFAITGSITKKEFKIIMKQHIKTTEIKELPKIINNLLEEAHKLFKIEISIAVIAGAGAVSKDRHNIKLTSNNLEINIENLRKHTMLKDYILLNNFEAEGYGLDFINKKKISRIGRTDIKSQITTSAILGAGHGLGASITYYDTTKHLKIPIPSEAGHMSLPVEIYFDLEFINYIREEFFAGTNVPISAEYAVSGKGVCLIYDFLITKKIYGEPLQNLKKTKEEEKVKKIFELKEDIYCKRAIELFVSYYAKTARNLAIATQPYSGLFLTGKVALAAKTTIHEYFMKDFLNSPTHKETLEKIPILLADDEELTLFGATNVATNFSKEFL